MRFDATVREDHVSTATITEHPIEEGASVSDHVRDDLDSIEMQIVVSNTPIDVPSDHADGVAGSQQSVELRASDGSDLGSALALVFDGTLARVRSVYEELLDLKERGQQLTVMTSLREYEDMVVKKVTPTRDAATGNSLVASVEFKQVSIVSSEIVDAPEPRETRGNNESERGRENTEEDGSESQSALARIGDTLSGFL